MSLQKKYLFYAEKLKNSNIENYYLESRIIFQHVLNLSYTDFILSNNMIINKEDQETLNDLFVRRISGVPLAYITNKQYFWKSSFYVNDNVLIPRADSETLIEAILKYFQDRTAKLNILEIGIGSGCLILSLLQEYQNAFGVGVDISEGALEVSQINAHKLNLLDRLNVYKSDIFSNIAGKFDIIISNPPYIANDDKEVTREVAEFEPKLALFAENDGLFFYHEILKQAQDYLNNKGHIFFEIGYKQKDQVKQAAYQYSYKYLETQQDIKQRDRVVILSLHND